MPAVCEWHVQPRLFAGAEPVHSRWYLNILFNAIVDVLYAVIDPKIRYLRWSAQIIVSKKNSEALEKFSEQLEVEGRSLWADTRRRFIYNKAALTSLFILRLIALFVILAPTLSAFRYDIDGI